MLCSHLRLCSISAAMDASWKLSDSYQPSRVRPPRAVQFSGGVERSRNYWRSWHQSSVTQRSRSVASQSWAGLLSVLVRFDYKSTRDSMYVCASLESAWIACAKIAMLVNLSCADRFKYPFDVHFRQSKAHFGHSVISFARGRQQSATHSPCGLR